MQYSAMKKRTKKETKSNAEHSIRIVYKYISLCIFILYRRMTAELVWNAIYFLNSLLSFSKIVYCKFNNSIATNIGVNKVKVI